VYYIGYQKEQYFSVFFLICPIEKLPFLLLLLILFSITGNFIHLDTYLDVPRDKKSLELLKERSALHTVRLTDLDQDSKMIMFESILTTFIARIIFGGRWGESRNRLEL
jgi:hypothetical protein